MKEFFEAFFVAIFLTLVFYLMDFKNIGIIALASISSFSLHVIAHKLVAKKLGLNANFGVWLPGIFGGIIASAFLYLFFRFMIFSPESISISRFRFKLKAKKITFEEAGIICLAGPLVNIFIATFFWIFEFPFSQTIVDVNSMLTIFTILPIGKADGAKIFYWKKWVWLLILLLALLLYAT